MFAVNYCCGNGKAFADRERIRIGGRKTARVCAEQLKLEEEQEEKRRQLEEEKEEKRRLLEEQKEEKR